jgi:hypothetical protein
MFICCAVLLVALVGIIATRDHYQATSFKPKSTPVLTVTATDADNGKTLHLTVGQFVYLQLSNSAWTFNPPTNPAVMKFLSTTAAAPTTQHPTGATMSEYKALSPGSASIAATAVIRPVCNARTMCPQYIAVTHYSITIDVER